jgi:hypothetical protein
MKMGAGRLATSLLKNKKTEITLSSHSYKTPKGFCGRYAPCISHAVSPNCWGGLAQNYGLFRQSP